MSIRKGVDILQTNEKMQEFVEKAKVGDIDAFEALIYANKAMLYRVGFSMLNSDEDTADAIQETLISAYKSIHKLRDNQYFKTWLVRIMINECKKVLRNRKRQVTIENMKNPETVYEEYCIENELKPYIEQLNSKLQQVIQLKYYEDFKISEIKKILNIPESTVKTRLSKAKKQLCLLIKGGM